MIEEDNWENKNSIKSCKRTEKTVIKLYNIYIKASKLVKY